MGKDKTGVYAIPIAPLFPNEFLNYWTVYAKNSM